jgi:Holliday junction DNA helicase RuvB
MTEKNPFQPIQADLEEVGAEKSLRPKSLAEFIGQERVVGNLRLAVDTALARGEVLDHVLFSGMPGLGKTTLAVLLASELGVNLRIASGPSLERSKDVVGLLTNLTRGDLLFIDEIHRMSAQAEEHLYTAMEDLAVDLIIDRGPDARSCRLQLPPFTLVGATTREGLLTAPLRSRFGIIEKLELYPNGELDEIIRRSAALLGCAIDEDASQLLASRSRGTPRYANRFLRRIRDVAQARAAAGAPPRRRPKRPQLCDEGPAAPGVGAPLRIDAAAVHEGLERLGVDANGLDRVDRQVLAILLANPDQPVGVKTIAVSVGEDERTIEDVYEPYLIRKGMVIKTPRGRLATPRAAELYGRLEAAAGARPAGACGAAPGAG